MILPLDSVKLTTVVVQISDPSQKSAPPLDKNVSMSAPQMSAPQMSAPILPKRGRLFEQIVLRHSWGVLYEG